MKPFKWRTRNTSYVYVDSATGSDSFGDGTMENPYQSLGKAWRGHTVVSPGTIVCRGRFCEDMADGNHSTTIRGDYFGAATFDGANSYTIYGFTTPNMFIENCAYGVYDTTVNTGSPILAGVGRAVYAHLVGNANFVYGVSAPDVLVRNSALYWGAVGGNGSVQRVGVVSPKPNPNNPFWFVSNSGTAGLLNSSFYNVPKEQRQGNRNSSGGIFAGCIFGKCAFFVDDGITFKSCIFTEDCTWWKNNEQFIPTGNTPEEKLQSLRDWSEHTEITTNSGNSKVRNTFDEDCYLSPLKSEEIWNNPDMGDLTIKFENAIDPYVTNAGYKGAFPPAINIPIMDDSTGKVNTWDEKTACGLISVADNKILIGKDDSSNKGEIKSKVIITKPNQYAISGIFAEYANQFKSLGIQLGNEREETPKDYSENEILPIGRYIIRDGDIFYKEIFVTEGEVIVVTEDGTSFSKSSGEPKAHEFLDSNIIDNMWLRTCITEYALIKSSDKLQAGGTYVNIYSKDITYRGRKITQGESFEAENSEDTFSCEGDSEYKIAILFDDTRVPSQPWIPAQLWGEYFASKIGGVYQTDDEGNVLGSGSYLAWLPASEGGYSASINKTIAQAKYIQLKITAIKE